MSCCGARLTHSLGRKMSRWLDRLNHAPAWAWLVGAVVVLALCLAVPVLRVLAPIAAMAIGAGVDDMTR